MDADLPCCRKYCFLPHPCSVIEEELRGIAREVKRQQAPRRPAIPLPRSGSRPGLPLRRRDSGGGGGAGNHGRPGGGLLRQGSGGLARQGSHGLAALGGSGMGAPAGLGLLAAAAMQRPVSSESMEGAAEGRAWQAQQAQRGQLPNGVGQGGE